MRPVRFLLLVSVAAVVAAVLASDALANGSGTISSAPVLPLGQQVASGWNQSDPTENGHYGEFWRVDLHTGDRLVLDLANTSSQCSGAPSVLVYDPSVTDASVADANTTLDYSTNDPKTEVVFVAPYDGRWTVFFEGCDTDSYTVRARVQASGTASTTGGSSVANAPPLPLGKKLATGWVQTSPTENGHYGEFWRVALHSGDRLVLDLANTTNQCGNAPSALIYAPSITQYTVANANPVLDHSTNDPKTQLAWTAPKSGNWTIFLQGCNTDSFTFVAHVRARTTTTVTAPQTVRMNKWFMIRGGVNGGSTPARGTMLLQRRSGRRWQTFAHAHLKANGTFTRRDRIVGNATTAPQITKIRIRYPGDANHLASAVVVTVVGSH